MRVQILCNEVDPAVPFGTARGLLQNGGQG
jgi:hypothetical protein